MIEPEQFRFGRRRAGAGGQRVAAHLRLAGPLDFEAIQLRLILAAEGIQIIFRHALDPFGQRLIEGVTGFVRGERAAIGEQRVLGMSFPGAGLDGFRELLDGLRDAVGMQQRIHIQMVEHVRRFGGVEHVAGFVHAKFFEDDGELILQHVAHAKFHAVGKKEIDGAHHGLLPDAIHAANALLDAHGIPGDVEIDDDVAELEVQAFAAGIGGNQDAHLLGERHLHLLTLVHAHAAVEAGDGDAAIAEKFRQHLLGGHELGEDEQLHVRVAFLLLEFVNPFEQRLGFGVRSTGFDLAGGGEQQFHLGALVLQRGEPDFEKRLELVLAVEVVPFVFHHERQHGELFARLLQRGETFFQCGDDGAGGTGDQPLHQNHEEPDIRLLLSHGLVVALADVFGDGIVKRLLVAVAVPAHTDELGDARLEQRIAVGIDGLPLLGADDVGMDALAGDAAGFGEGVLVQQRHQPVEGIGFALVRRGRQQQEVRAGFRQAAPQLMPGDLIGTPADAVRLVHDDQIPARRDQILEPLLVELVDVVARPALAGFQRFDRIQRANDLIERAPEIFNHG